jgi:hypothetical protein
MKEVTEKLRHPEVVMGAHVPSAVAFVAVAP